jgi:hypothetical protein
MSVDTFVAGYLSERSGQPTDLDRLVTSPSGLTPEQMMEAIGHPDLGKLGIPLMADFMAPDGSMYYDAIFGAFHGQLAIRQWLVPAMAEIDFIDFVPTAEPVWFDDGQGGSSLDEWRMVMNLDGEKIPLSRGVSVRRYRNGWITWGCDVYDTASFRQPPPPDMAEPPPPLPPPPVVEWTSDPSAHAKPLDDPRRSAGPFHPTDSVYIDPIAGELRGEAAISRWLTDVATAGGVFEPLGPLLSDGVTSVQEWKHHAVAGSDTALRGTSVRRVVDGLTVYAADYYDTASPAIDTF